MRCLTKTTFANYCDMITASECFFFDSCTRSCVIISLRVYTDNYSLAHVAVFLGKKGITLPSSWPRSTLFRAVEGVKSIQPVRSLPFVIHCRRVEQWPRVACEIEPTHQSHFRLFIDNSWTVGATGKLSKQANACRIPARKGRATWATWEDETCSLYWTGQGSVTQCQVQ